MLWNRWVVVVFLAVGARGAFAQEAEFPPDTQAASTDAPGRDYPRVDSQRRAYFALMRPKLTACGSASVTPT